MTKLACSLISADFVFSVVTNLAVSFYRLHHHVLLLLPLLPHIHLRCPQDVDDYIDLVDVLIDVMKDKVNRMPGNDEQPMP